jgi:hypothetical protein
MVSVSVAEAKAPIYSDFYEGSTTGFEPATAWT